MKKKIKIFTDKPRSYPKASEILGFKPETLYQKQWKLKKKKVLKTYDTLMYRAACNLSDELLEILTNDENFNMFKLKTLDK